MTLTPKQWATAQAQAAIQGISLLRTDPVDGAVQVLANRFGLVRMMPPNEVEDLIKEPGSLP